MSLVLLTCPYADCGVTVEIIELNCRIFRCGVLKATGQQIPPHAPKEECDGYVRDGLIYGCGRPFRVDGENPDFSSHSCGYC